MRTAHTRLLGGAALLFVAVFALQCTTPPAPAPPAEPAPTPGADLQAVVSIRELMTHWIDPLSDNIFDAVASDFSATGVVETMPRTDEDWARVQQGAVALAEGSLLLKLPRRVAPADDNVAKNPGELPPAEIEASIEKNRGAWNAFSDGMRSEALKVMEIVKARDTQALFKAGSDLDQVCESCHLTFWYPGDRDAVLKDRNSTVFKEPARPARP